MHMEDGDMKTNDPANRADETTNQNNQHVADDSLPSPQPNPSTSKIQEEVRELSRINSSLLEDVEALKEQIRTQERTSEEVIKLRKECAESEQRNQELERTAKRLEAQIAAPQEPSTVVTDDIGSAKATFRIDLYSRQGNGDYAGRITHLLTKDWKPLDLLDKEAIAAFIAAHLPRIEGKDVVQSLAPTSAPVTSKHPIPLATATDALRLTVHTRKRKAPTQSVAHDESFKIQIVFDERKLELEQGATHSCATLLEAKRLGGSQRLTVGEYKGLIPSDRTLEVEVPPRTLPLGKYRMSARITMSSPKGQSVPVRLVEESSFINVY